MCGSPTAGDVTERAWKLPNKLLWTTSTITTGAAQVELVTVDGCHVRVSNCCCFLFTSTSTHVTHTHATHTHATHTHAHTHAHRCWNPAPLHVWASAPPGDLALAAARASSWQPSATHSSGALTSASASAVKANIILSDSRPAQIGRILFSLNNCILIKFHRLDQGEILCTRTAVSPCAAQVKLFTADGCHVRVTNSCCFIGFWGRGLSGNRRRDLATFASTSAHVTSIAHGSWNPAPLHVRASASPGDLGLAAGRASSWQPSATHSSRALTRASASAVKANVILSDSRPAQVVGILR